ncbi:MAG: dnaA [Hyphomicrobiales bacterium]|nr:dnaA [Hyphomicrobiales bacterium]
MLKPRLDSVQADCTKIVRFSPESSERPTSSNHSEAWQRVCRRLRAEVGEDVFNSWFGRLELDEIQDDVARLSVPTKFLKSWIQSHYTDRIVTALASEVHGVGSLAIVVRTSGRVVAARPVELPVLARFEDGAQRVASNLFAPPSATAQRREPETIGRETKHLESEALGGSPLDRRLTFASFLVGKSNQLAHAAAQRVAQAPASEAPLYNPLYIHASVGLGKTHLIQAVAHTATDVGRRVIYLTAEKFMYGFVSALKAQTAIAFKEKLRAIDVLVIDDVQFLQGKSIQQEFCHTLNALIDAGRQVVIAADRPPSELESLDERVRSRLAGGLCVEMGSLDEALRVKILETRIAVARASQPTFEVPAAVVSFVARSIQTNGRDLDGAVNRLLAHVTLTGTALTVETAEIAIRDLVRTREPKRVKIEDIQKLVATHFNVSRADILSSRRTATVVRPRQIAMYLAKVLTLRSLPEIGRRFGGRDHTTVLHAVRKIEGLANQDNQLSEELELLKRMLTD